MRHPILLIGAVGVLAAFVACGHKDDSQTAQQDYKAQADSVAARLAKASTGTGGHQFGPPTGKIRVGNFLELGGKPVGPLDLYDMRQPDSSAKPLISNLAFGQVSDYVSPRATGNFAGSRSNLYIFPAGSKTATAPLGDRIDNAGFDSTDQITVALGPTSFGNGQGVSLPAIDEAGKRVNAWRDSTRMFPATQGLLILLKANTNVDGLPELYLKVDDACPLNANDPRNPHPVSVGSDVNLVVPPGAHSLGIVTSPRGQGLLTCAGKTTGPTTMVTVAPGQKYIVFVFGLPTDDYKIQAAQLLTP